MGLYCQYCIYCIEYICLVCIHILHPGLEGKDLTGGHFFHSIFQLVIGTIANGAWKPNPQAGLLGDEILLPLWLEHRP